MRNVHEYSMPRIFYEKNPSVLGRLTSPIFLVYSRFKGNIHEYYQQIFMNILRIFNDIQVYSCSNKRGEIEARELKLKIVGGECMQGNLSETYIFPPPKRSLNYLTLNFCDY